MIPVGHPDLSGQTHGVKPGFKTGEELTKSWDDHLEDMNVACVASMCVHVHVHAQSLSHPAGMAMLQVWSLVGRWHSQCGVSGPKIDSRTPTNVNHQYLTVYSRLSGMVVDICRSLVLCLRLNPEAIKRREAVQ